MISAGGCVEESIAGIRCGWTKFREILLLLNSVFSLHTNCKLFQGCVRSVALDGSETWALKKED